jgi:hypothetical protein
MNAPKEAPNPIFQRARVMIQAVNETIADLRTRSDSGRWAEQIRTLEAMHERLAAELAAAENAA